MTRKEKKSKQACECMCCEFRQWVMSQNRRGGRPSAGYPDPWVNLIPDVAVFDVKPGQIPGRGRETLTRNDDATARALDALHRGKDPVLDANQVLRQYGEGQAYVQEYRSWHYRASATAQAAYNFDRQATDCYYWGKDEPGLHARHGEAFTHDVTLTGFLLDKCNGMKVLKRTTIHFVRAGTAGLPATYGPPAITVEGDRS